MNAEEIQAGLALCEKATPPPWKRCAHLEKAPCGCGGNHGFMYGAGEGDSGIILEMFHEEDRRDEDGPESFHGGVQLPSREQVLANAAFIETARTLLPRALSALEACQREREELTSRLEMARESFRVSKQYREFLSAQHSIEINTAEAERDQWKALAIEADEAARWMQTTWQHAVNQRPHEAVHPNANVDAVAKRVAAALSAGAQGPGKAT